MKIFKLYWLHKIWLIIMAILSPGIQPTYFVPLYIQHSILTITEKQILKFSLLKSNKYAKKNLAMWLLFRNFFIRMGTNKPLIKKSFRSQSNYFTYTSGSKQWRRIDRFDSILWSNIDGYYITINVDMMCPRVSAITLYRCTTCHQTSHKKFWFQFMEPR